MFKFIIVPVLLTVGLVVGLNTSTDQTGAAQPGTRTAAQPVLPGAVLTAQPVLTRQDRIRHAFATLPACLTDEPEGPDCAWNAQVEGNKRGHSFVRLAGVVHYIDGWDGVR